MAELNAARQSPVARRLHRWATGEHSDTDVAADVRALLDSYNVVLIEVKRLRGIKQRALDMAASQRFAADRRAAREILGDF